MSVHAAAKPTTVPDLRRMKGTPQVWLTAYTTPIAQRLDPHCDALLVGDSLGMVLYGLPSTLAVTLDMMIGHGAAVVRGAKHACVVVDMPFGSYQQSPQQAFASAARVLAETGASAECDGQVLVIDDVLGTFNDFTPRFVKRYAELGEEISKAAAAYAADVRARAFPGVAHVFRKKA